MSAIPNSKPTNLIASHYDHSPILLSCDTVQINRSRYLFLFEKNWLKEDGIKDVVCNGWNFEKQVEVVKILSYCAENLEKWSKNIRWSRKDDIERQKNTMDMYIGGQDSFSADWYIEVFQEFNKSLLSEDVYWRQRAKIHWLTDGDMNTRFFHLSATTRNVVKKILNLSHDGGKIVKD